MKIPKEIEDKMPQIVPILDSNDLCRNNLVQGKKHCLVGWCIKTFQPYGFKIDLFVRALLFFETKTNLSTFNDDTNNSLQDIANVWNKVMKKLGYVVSCNRIK